ncbi:MAG: sigma-70 family RNA polymerase sigma factor [Lachnospiraceae bacterium]|nr:sigma-70 family RNA polymerase sigma factor [Lachnospiraceae bacterium]
MGKISAVVNRAVCTENRLAELIDTYDKLVFSICYKLTGDYFTSEDLMQETFLSAFQKYDTFDGVNEKAWICRIATNKSIDYLRSASRRSVPTEDAFFEAEVEMRGSPEEICMEEEIRNELIKRCEELRPPYNEVAKDYYIKELSAREIAEKQGQSVKTIQTQIYRARELLKKRYGKEESA